jgi:5'-methylthioadenosine phosphorylase
MAGTRKADDARASVGILGGTGLYDIDGIKDTRDVRVPTPFGTPSAPLSSGRSAAFGWPS